MEQVASYLVGEAVTVADYHQEWADQLRAQYPDLTDKEKPLKSSRTLLGAIFARVLEDAGSLQTDRTRADDKPLITLWSRSEFCQTRSFLLAQSYKSSILVSFEISGGNDEDFHFDAISAFENC